MNWWQKFSDKRRSPIYQFILTWRVNRNIEKLNHNHPGNRIKAIKTLAKLQDLRAVEPLIEKLGDGYHGVRSAAVIALGNLGDPRAIEPLLDAWWDKHQSMDRYLPIRLNVCYAFGRIGTPEAFEALLLKMNEHNTIGVKLEWSHGDVDASVRATITEVFLECVYNGINIPIPRIIAAWKRFIDVQKTEELKQKAHWEAYDSLDTLVSVMRKHKHPVEGNLSRGKPRVPAGRKGKLVRVRRVGSGY